MELDEEVAYASEGGSHELRGAKSIQVVVGRVSGHRGLVTFWVREEIHAFPLRASLAIPSELQRLPCLKRFF